MATVTLFNNDDTVIDNAMRVVASLAPTAVASTDPSTSAQYKGGNYVILTGVGFVYDAAGRLSGGTVTGISYGQSPVTSGIGPNAGFLVAITGVAAPVTTLLTLVNGGQSILPTLLSGSNVFSTQSRTVTGSAGNDVINVRGPATNYSSAIFLGDPPVDRTVVNVDGGGGQNTVGFSDNLRSSATLTGGGGTETVQLPSASITANLVNSDALQFLDGTTYETNASPGAQAALEFEGVMGRLPDAINAGGFALLAQQNGTFAAADQILSTSEGRSDTANLSNADFAARLYQTMLHRAPDSAGLAGWQAALDSGAVSRGGVVALFAAGPEAQSANFVALASGSVFGADPNAVEVLRAYETLLTRLPEQVSLVYDAKQLDAGMSLQSFYSSVQLSQEFAARAPNPYGITAGTAYGSVYAVAHTDPINSTIAPLVTSSGVGHQ